MANVDRSAVGRILQQLEALDVLIGESGKYEPGPRLYALARTVASHDTLPTAAMSVLNDLVAEFDETCYVCVLHGDSVVFLYSSQSSKPLRYVVEIGRPVPIHAGASGRSILTGLPEDEARRLLESTTLEQLTDKTECDIDALMKMREADLDRHYSVSVGERVADGSAIAAPFFDHTGRCQGAVVLTAPQSRHRKMRKDEVGTAVRHAANALSTRLGAVGLQTSNGLTP